MLDLYNIIYTHLNLIIYFAFSLPACLYLCIHNVYIMLHATLQELYKCFYKNALLLKNTIYQLCKQSIQEFYV